MDIETRLRQAEARLAELIKNESLTETIDNNLAALKSGLPKDLADLITEADNNPDVKAFQKSWFNIAVCYKVAKEQNDTAAIEEFELLENLLEVKFPEFAQFCYAILTAHETYDIDDVSKNMNSFSLTLGWKLYTDDLTHLVDITDIMGWLVQQQLPFTQPSILTMFENYKKAQKVLNWYSSQITIDYDDEDDDDVAESLRPDNKELEEDFTNEEDSAEDEDYEEDDYEDEDWSDTKSYFLICDCHKGFSVMPIALVDSEDEAKHEFYNESINWLLDQLDNWQGHGVLCVAYIPKLTDEAADLIRAVCGSKTLNFHRWSKTYNPDGEIVLPGTAIELTDFTGAIDNYLSHGSRNPLSKEQLIQDMRTDKALAHKVFNSILNGKIDCIQEPATEGGTSLSRWY